MRKMQSIAVGGVPVLPIPDMEGAVAQVFTEDGSVRPGFGVAINPEKVMRARRDPALLSLLNAASLPFADGIGVVRTLRRKGAPVRRIAGADLWQALMERAGVQQTPVFLLGARQDVLDTVLQRLKAENGQTIAGARNGYFSDEDEAAVIQSIVDARPAIVTVAMGSPRQERFILRARSAWPDAFYLGVGGTFDVYAGRVKRAPLFMQAAGLEWLYRLLREPRRYRRQFVCLHYQYLHMAGRL